jgi:phosphonate transport system substrate-binding protein
LAALQYVAAHAQDGVEAELVGTTRGKRGYRGQIIVRSDSAIWTLEDLRGRTFCWGNRYSTAGHLIPRVFLAAHGIDESRDFIASWELGDDVTVVEEVYSGECDGGATYFDARETVVEDYPDVAEVVSILATTPEIPYVNVSFAAGVPEPVRGSVVDALLRIQSTPMGQDALLWVFGVESLEATDNAQWDPLRDLLQRAEIPIEAFAQ